MFPFRISVALHYFFQDKRSLSYILVDDRFSTIKDLQNHIKQIFCIQKDIYLTCNNHLLPITEGVEIVKRDETIIVVQDDSNQHHNQNVTNIEKITNRPQKQSKRKHLVESSENHIENVHNNNSKNQNTEKIITTESNIPNQKCEITSNKESLDTNSLLNFVVLDNVNIDRKLSPSDYDEVHLENNLSNGKQNSSKLSIFDENINCPTKKIKQDDSTVNSVNVKIIENKIISEQQVAGVKNIEPNIYEKSHLKDKNEETEWEKWFNQVNKENILKNSQNKDELVIEEISDKLDDLASIYTENKLSEINLSDDSTNKVTSSNLCTINHEEKFSNFNISQKINKYDNSQIKNNANIHITSNTSEESKSLSGSVETCSKIDNEYSDQKVELNLNKLIVTEENKNVINNSNNCALALKKTRKRKRKRNSLKRNDFDREETFLQPIWSSTLTKINFSNTPKQRIHIRFSDNDFSDSELSSLEQNKLSNENIDKDSYKNDSDDTNKLDSLLMNRNSSLESIIKNIDLKRKELDLSLFKLICKETLPLINDVIAFKIFQLNEVYEPYITDWIIGTVIDLKSTVVEIKILAGKIKTSVPKGKFYMEYEDEKSETNEYENEAQLNWSVMINPHVLLL